MFKLSEFAQPYPFAANFVVGATMKWKAANHPGDDLIIAFEKGDTYQGRVPRLLEDWGHNLASDPLFIEKKWSDSCGDIHRVLAFQACDYLAYEISKNMTDLLERGKRRARESLLALNQATGAGSRRYRITGKPFYLTVCRELGIQKRR